MTASSDTRVKVAEPAPAKGGPFGVLSDGAPERSLLGRAMRDGARVIVDYEPGARVDAPTDRVSSIEGNVAELSDHFVTVGPTVGGVRIPWFAIRNVESLT